MSWYKLHKQAQSKGTISFDFDDTLTQPEFNPVEGIWVSVGPNEETISKMREYYDEGYKILIVTSRQDKDMGQVQHFVEKHNLPVSGIYNTNGDPKAPLLRELGVLMHYDDDPQEIEDAEAYNVNIERVWHPLDVEMENATD